MNINSVMASNAGHSIFDGANEVPSLRNKIIPLLGIVVLATSPAVLANPLTGLINNLTQLQSQPTQKQEAKPAAKQEQATEEGGKKYATGYSQAFYPVKEQLKSGSTALALKTHKETFLNKDSSFLSQVEHGVVALDTKNPKAAIMAFTTAEQILGEEYAGSKLGSLAESSSRNILSMITGSGEITNYPGEPFERILMLNYKSIAYMLQGERKAYNVARRSIDWQNIEKDRFRVEVKEAQEEQKKQLAKQKEKGNNLTGFGFADTMNKYYGNNKKKATK